MVTVAGDLAAIGLHLGYVPSIALFGSRRGVSPARPNDVGDEQKERDKGRSADQRCFNFRRLRPPARNLRRQGVRPAREIRDVVGCCRAGRSGVRMAAGSDCPERIRM